MSTGMNTQEIERLMASATHPKKYSNRRFFYVFDHEYKLPETKSNIKIQALVINSKTFDFENIRFLFLPHHDLIQDFVLIRLGNSEFGFSHTLANYQQFSVSAQEYVLEFNKQLKIAQNG